MKLFFYLLWISCATIQANSPVLTPSIVLREVVVSKKNRKYNKPKFRWKRIFRPIIIAGRRSWFWILFFGVFGALLIGAIISGEPESGYDNWVYIPIGTAFLFFGIAILLIPVTPLVWIWRIFEELRWRRRFRRCFWKKN